MGKSALVVMANLASPRGQQLGSPLIQMLEKILVTLDNQDHIAEFAALLVAAGQGSPVAQQELAELRTEVAVLRAKDEKNTLFQSSIRQLMAIYDGKAGQDVVKLGDEILELSKTLPPTKPAWADGAQPKEPAHRQEEREQSGTAPQTASQPDPAKLQEKGNIVQIGGNGHTASTESIAWRNALIDAAATGDEDTFIQVLNDLRGADENKNYYPVCGVIARMNGANRGCFVSMRLAETAEALHEALLDKLARAFTVIDRVMSGDTGAIVSVNGLRLDVQRYEKKKADKAEERRKSKGKKK